MHAARVYFNKTGNPAAQDAVHARCGVKILDPIPYLCPDGVCHGSKDGRPLYFDDDHLSEYGNKLLVPMFAEVFRRHEVKQAERNRAESHPVK